MEDKQRRERLYRLWEKFQNYSLIESLFKRIFGDPNFDEFCNELMRHYSEPHRVYHNLNHIDQCLKEFDSVRHLAVNPDAVEMAIWLHDVVYDPQRKDNEWQSAQLAVRCSFHYHWLSRLAHDLDDLILATQHNISLNNANEKLLVDIDLAILGQPEEAFDEYEQQIRQEYSWAPEEQFRSGRLAILQSFLNRPTIYSAGYFLNRYEAQARKNLKRSIARLT